MNKCLAKALGIFIFIFGAWAYLRADEANERLVPQWSTTCQSDDIPFSIDFKSKSGDAYEDDMDVTIRGAGGSTINVPLPRAAYVRRGMVSDVKNVCKDIAAIALSDKKLLLLISSDGRPGWDQLNLVYININTGKILDVKADVGEIKDVDGHQNLTVRRRPNGFEVRLQREWLSDTGTDSAENSIEDWRSITILDGKILTEWSK